MTSPPEIGRTITSETGQKASDFKLQVKNMSRNELNSRESTDEKGPIHIE